MTRPLRIEFPNAWYHVMNRGAGRQVIFHKADHFQFFIELLSDIHSRFGIETHSFCLMNNHYHLLLKTPRGMLGRAMQYLNGTYAKYYNRIRGKDGPLFKNRYKAIIIDADEYLLQLSRYIHLNPLEAKIVSHPEKYKWSSYRYYITQGLTPEWLYCNEILSRFNNRIENYIKFVTDTGMQESENGMKNRTISSILGSDEFINTIKKSYAVKGNLTEIPDHRIIEKINYPKVDDVIKAVALYFKVPVYIITNSPNKKEANIPRKIALYLSVQLTGETQQSIASAFTGISCKGVSRAMRRFTNDLKMSNQWLTTLNEIIKICNNIKH